MKQPRTLNELVERIAFRTERLQKIIADYKEGLMALEPWQQYIQDRLEGFKRVELVALAARRNTGKTMLGMIMAEHYKKINIEQDKKEPTNETNRHHPKGLGL